MTASRAAVVTATASVAVVGIGFLTGYPAEVAAATAIALAAVVSALTTRDLAARAEVRARPEPPVSEHAPPRRLRDVADALAAARRSAFAVDRELRPLLRPIAAMRLARRGIDLDRHPSRAHALLGEPLWDLVQAGSACGPSVASGGIAASDLDSLIERLERI